MSDKIMIPESHYSQRIAKASRLIAEAGLDVLVANSNEADYANVRYFTAYWPLFEMGGVAIAPSGQAALLIGPESETYAQGRSTLDNIHLMTEYRETADPAYPGVPVSKYGDVFESIGVRHPKRIGLAGYLCTNMAMAEGLREAFPDAEIVNVDDTIMTRLRSIKSPEEIACLREGLRLGELAMKAMIEAVKPGMTELELTGVAIETLYRNGAESEAHTVYAFGGKKTTNAISRGTHRRFEKGDIVQINVGGKIDGYSPSVGRPVCLGKMTDEQKKLIDFGKEMHYKTYEWMQTGVISGDIAKKYENHVKKAGFGEYYLYGPCHGLGMIEVEKPWLETVSTYKLEPNMTFQADTFFAADDFGLRWENGLLVTGSGPAEMLNEGSRMELIEVDC
jgi:Xaa-Pro aminopeptidase